MQQFTNVTAWLMVFWTPYADWIYTVVSTVGLLLIIGLVLRPRG